MILSLYLKDPSRESLIAIEECRRPPLKVLESFAKTEQKGKRQQLLVALLANKSEN